MKFKIEFHVEVYNNKDERVRQVYVAVPVKAEDPDQAAKKLAKALEELVK